MKILMKTTFLHGKEETVEEFDFLTKDGLNLHFRVPLNLFSKEELEHFEEKLNSLVMLMVGNTGCPNLHINRSELS